MKNLCNKIMRLDTSIGIKTDYSPIAFVMWLDEFNILISKKDSILSFSTYLFRFYIDNKELACNHPLPLIRNIQKYSPGDLINYSKEILFFIQNRTNIIDITENEILLLKNNQFSEKELAIYQNVKKMMIKKFIPDFNPDYTTVLSNDEFDKKSIRLFNRVLESINYCFICETTDTKCLSLIQLKKNCTNKEKYDLNNYLVLCDEHARLFNKGDLVIRKNGYPYICEKRLLSHLEIKVLKKIRHYLND